MGGHRIEKPRGTEKALLDLKQYGNDYKDWMRCVTHSFRFLYLTVSPNLKDLRLKTITEQFCSVPCLKISSRLGPSHESLIQDLVLNLRSVVFVSFSSRMPWLSARLRAGHRHPDVDTERRIPVIAKKSQAAGMARIPRSRLEEYGRGIKKRAQERLASSASAAAAQPSGERTKYSNNGSFRIMRRGDEVFGRGSPSHL